MLVVGCFGGCVALGFEWVLFGGAALLGLLIWFVYGDCSITVRL